MQEVHRASVATPAYRTSASLSDIAKNHRVQLVDSFSSLFGNFRNREGPADLPGEYI